MKKTIKILSLMLFMMLALSANAFSAVIDSSGGELDLFVAGTSVDANDGSAAIGLSPKVVAKYKSDGTNSTDTQWYAISAIHPGGNKVYGTAQNINNVYSQDHATGSNVDDSLDKIPASEDSAIDWSNNNWEL